MSTIALTATHAKYTLIETTRTPMAIIGSLVFPALALLFFVVPQRVVADDPVYATQAIVSMSVFSVMVGSLFSFGLNTAEARQSPWDPYLRTLPAPGIARVLAQVLSTGLITLVSLVPILIIGAIFTSASATPLQVVLGLLAIAVAALPFMFLGLCIGYAFSMKAAIAIIQVAFFALAFAGGLFLPPQILPGWLEVLSRFLPSRQAREFVIWAVQGGALEWWVPVGLAAWIVALLTLTLVLYRRDEGRRYR